MLHLVSSLHYLLIAEIPATWDSAQPVFLRDTAGSIGLHQAAPLQYIRPELIGLIFGALVSALFAKEFRARGGSSPFIRLILGAFAMIGALTFLGCPWRAYLRLGGGDLSAICRCYRFICRRTRRNFL